MAKPQKLHNEYFKLITKTTCDCGIRKTVVYSWGEYIFGKWRTISHICQACFPQVINRIQAHTGNCGCVVKLVGYRGQKLPYWLKLPEVCNRDEVIKLAV